VLTAGHHGHQPAEQRAHDAHHVCIALIDIDFFKKIKDKYSHAGGDKRSFARAAGAAVRTTKRAPRSAA
jgi:diguanylate cyclase (GGDEF)-like protein